MIIIDRDMSASGNIEKQLHLKHTRAEKQRLYLSDNDDNGQARLLQAIRMQISSMVVQLSAESAPLATILRH